ncbi:MAG TPA: hypothetical protein VN915_06585 [Elusimicrobiota bacterium]|nr:hypothetical protein [Elusimicrobiota bacterium]
MKNLALLALLSAALPAAAAVSPAAVTKFTNALTKAMTDSKSVGETTPAFQSKYQNQLQRTLKDSKCVLQGNKVSCAAADADSLDAGSDDVAELQTLVDQQKAVAKATANSQSALSVLQNLAAEFGKVGAAIPNVKDNLARTNFTNQLHDEAAKVRCTNAGNVYNCVHTTLTGPQIDPEIEKLKTLLDAVTADNSSNTRPARITALAHAANQAFAAIKKVLSSQDQNNFFQQLDQRIGRGGDGCQMASGAYDCSQSLVTADKADKEAAWLSTFLATVTAQTNNPRPDLLKQLNQAVNQVAAVLPNVRYPNDRSQFSQTFNSFTSANACTSAGGVWDCSKTAVKTEMLQPEIGSMQSLLGAANSSIAAVIAGDPQTKTKAQLADAANKVVAAIAALQNPGPRAGFTQRLGDTLKGDGCAQVSGAWDCSKAPDSSSLTDDLGNVQGMLAQLNQPDVNRMDSQSQQILADILSSLPPIIRSIANPDHLSAQTAKLNAVVAEAGCTARGSGYECSKTTYNQYQKANPDATALKTTVFQTAGTDGDPASHTAQATAALALLKLGWQLSPATVRNQFSTDWTNALTKAGCSASLVAVDCSRATAAQIGRLASDLNALQSKTQAQIAGGASRAAANNPKIAASMDQAIAVLANTDKMIDGAAITDQQKTQLYARVSALRDQIESQDTGPAPQQAVTNGQKVVNAMGGDLLSQGIGSIADGVAPTKTSGSFGPAPSAQAAILMSQIQTQINMWLLQARQH